MKSRRSARPKPFRFFVIRRKNGFAEWPGRWEGWTRWSLRAASAKNAPEVRARICEGLSFLGLELNEAGNKEGAVVISGESGRVTVRVIRTDEEWIIAKTVSQILGLGPGRKN